MKDLNFSFQFLNHENLVLQLHFHFRALYECNIFYFWNFNGKQASVNLTDPNKCDLCLIAWKSNQYEELVQ